MSSSWLKKSSVHWDILINSGLAMLCHMCAFWGLRIHPSEPLKTFIIEAFQATQAQSGTGVSCNLLSSSHFLREKCLWNNAEFHNVPGYNTSVKVLMWGRMSSYKDRTHFSCLPSQKWEITLPSTVSSKQTRR